MSIKAIMSNERPYLPKWVSYDNWTNKLKINNKNPQVGHCFLPTIHDHLPMPLYFRGNFKIRKKDESTNESLLIIGYLQYWDAYEDSGCYVPRRDTFLVDLYRMPASNQRIFHCQLSKRRKQTNPRFHPLPSQSMPPPHFALSLSLSLFPQEIIYSLL